MMTPLAARSAGRQARARAIGATRFTSRIDRTSLGSSSSIGPVRLIPALFTRASSRPQRSNTYWPRRATASSSVTSQWTVSKGSSVPLPRTVPMTSQPNSTKRSATARPSPDDVPVTRATEVVFFDIIEEYKFRLRDIEDEALHYWRISSVTGRTSTIQLEVGATGISLHPWADGGFNRSEQHLELEVCTWEDRKVGRQQSLGGPHSGFRVTPVCDASTVRRSGLRSLAG